MPAWTARSECRLKRSSATGDGRRAMGDGRWAMGDGRWAMGDGRGKASEQPTDVILSEAKDLLFALQKDSACSKL